MASPSETKELILPEGYSVRVTTLDDAEASVKLWEIVSTHMGVPEILDAAEERREWQEPRFNLADSSIVIEDAEGNLVGIALLFDNAEVPVRSWLNWNVHPAHEGKGLEEYLINWLENTAQRVIDRCPPDVQISFAMGTMMGYEPRMKAYEAADYKHVRNFLRMKVTLSEAAAQPKLPQGFSIRSMNYPEDFKAAILARTAAFRDHWGFVQESEEKILSDWKHYLEHDNLFEPALHYLAIDDASGEVAGLVFGRMEEHGSPEHAYVAQVGVPPKYRKKGLAEALLLHCFGEFWRRGKATITLYVDASSLTGATRLYEKVGMRADRTWARFEKVIRDGIDLSTTAVHSE